MEKFDTGGVSEFSHFLLYFYSLFTYQTCVMGGGGLWKNLIPEGGVEPKFNPECVQSKLNAGGGGSVKRPKFLQVPPQWFLI